MKTIKTSVSNVSVTPRGGRLGLAAGALLAALGFALSAPAATRYVNVNNPTPQPPYDTFETAATNISEAVLYAYPGELILVTNGVYRTGGFASGGGSLRNRVVVGPGMTVRSINGPQVTIIEGQQVPGATNGDGATRCAYLVGGAILSGFTLTNGATRLPVTLVPDQCGGGVFCESTNAVVTNCIITGCSAYLSGGGAYGGSLINCTITRNSANSGGGGAYEGRLINCMLTGNSASYGGGAAGAGKDSKCRLNNCTLTGNSASSGGGTSGGTLNNCIVYYNSATVQGANYNSGTLNYCCTTPMPTGGTGNITNEPGLASASHLSSGSPCRAAGNAAYALGTDIDGEPWLSPPSIGCDEFYSGSATGLLAVAVSADWTNVTVGLEVGFKALIEGRASASAWDFGDGVVVSNRPYASHSWSSLGTYPVVLTAYNDSNPGGVSATVTVQVVTQPVHYVRLDSAAASPPYSSWETAATNIQEAVDAASGSAPGALVLVSNGVYRTGGRVVHGAMTNRVAVAKLLTVQSVNGPDVTCIEGYQVPGLTNGDGAIRCAYLAEGAVLSGFTLTNGATRAEGNYTLELSGGGVWCASGASLTNCIITGNSAYYEGGGACRGTLNNCALTGNSAYQAGGHLMAS